MMTLRFSVAGVPEPQGSARAVPVGRKGGPKRIVITHDNPDLLRWRQAVGTEALIAMRQARFPFLDEGPVRVRIEFRMPRPQRIKDRLSEPCTVRPDVDKLARGVLDGLSGVVFADDAQVDALEAVKKYAAPAMTPSAIVEVESGFDEWV